MTARRCASAKGYTGSMVGHCKLVVVTANPAPQSNCKVLADLIAARAAKLIHIDERIDIEIGVLIPELGAVLLRSDLPPRAEAAIRQIERADLLVVCTPVYKGSYTGHFKHVFDLVEPSALTSVPVALAATGQDYRHYLVVEHQLRPLFGFFQAFALPTAVYAADADFERGSLRNPLIQARINAVAIEAALTVNLRSHHEHAVAPTQQALK
jgi:FMN reductase